MRFRICLFVMGPVLAGTAASAAVISGNYCSVASIADFPAGFVPVGNWNDFTAVAGYGSNDSATNLIYSDGSPATGTGVRWDVSNGGSQNTNDQVFRPLPPATLGQHIDDGHDQMMTGYLQASKNSTTLPFIRLKGTGIDTDYFGGSYSVIVYFDGDGDAASDGALASMAVYTSEFDYLTGTLPLVTYYGRDPLDTNYAVTNDGTAPLSVYQRISSTNPAAPTAGNYIQFDGLTNSEFFVVLAGLPGQHGVAMNGFQIVPEPATLGFLALGSLGLLRRRR